MKNVWLATFLLVLAVGLVVFNALWGEAKLQSLLSLAEQDRPEEALQEFLRPLKTVALQLFTAWQTVLQVCLMKKS